MNKKIIEDIIEYTIGEYNVKCRGSQYYYNQFSRNRESFQTERPYDKNKPPGRGEFEMKQIHEQEKVDFTDDEIDYIYDYTDEGYSRVNPMLYDNDDWHRAIDNGWVIESDIEYYEDERKHLDSAIEKAPRLTQDTILFHGGIFDGDLKVGDVSNWKGFTSTSYDESVSRDVFTGNNYENPEYLVKIYAPKGTKGVVITGELGQGMEHEFLLKENQRFQVLNIDKNTNPPSAEVLLLPFNYTRGYD